jgi:hypothetical protein
VGRKAQVAGQVFIYITAIVVVGFIIVYGYSAITKFTQRGQEVEYISLKTSMENSFKAIVSDYGSIKRPDIDIPGKYTAVCFIDKENFAAKQSTPICGGGGDTGADKYNSPIACAAWATKRSNVFLLPDGSDNFDVGTIQIEGGAPYICFNVVNNKIRLQLESMGDKVKVSEYSE